MDSHGKYWKSERPSPTQGPRHTSFDREEKLTERKSCRSQGLISLPQSQNSNLKNFERARLKIGSRREATFHGCRNPSTLPKLQPPALTRSWSRSHGRTGRTNLPLESDVNFSLKTFPWFSNPRKINQLYPRLH